MQHYPRHYNRPQITCSTEVANEKRKAEGAEANPFTDNPPSFKRIRSAFCPWRIYARKTVHESVSLDPPEQNGPVFVCVLLLARVDEQQDAVEQKDAEAEPGQTEREPVDEVLRLAGVDER